MPIYTYECEKCRVRFDKHQKFSDKPLTRCPECKGTVRRLIQPAGIVFKGSGWYITDSKKSSSATVSSTKDTPKDSKPPSPDKSAE
jgi:putative FmdB family regulatory protein